MASLYESSKLARKGLIVFLVFVAIAIVFDNLDLSPEGDGVVNEADRFYMFAAREFGEIPAPTIPGLDIDTDDSVTFIKQFDYSTFPDVAYVYSIKKPSDNPLTFINAQQSVEKLGFIKDDYQEIRDNEYIWKTDNGTRTLQFNSVNQVWDLNTTFFNNVNALANKNLMTDRDDYAGAGLNLIEDLGFDTTGFSDGRVNVQYASLGSDGIFKAEERYTSAEYVFLDFQRRLRFADLKDNAQRPELEEGEELPPIVDALVYSTDSRKGQISMIVSNEVDDYAKDVFKMDFTNYEYSTTRGAYLLITPEEAWTKVQNNQGSLVYLVPQGANVLGEMSSLNVVRYVMDASKTELAYWEPSSWTGFVYPIYIFRGRAELQDGRQASFVFFVEGIKRLS